MTIPPYHVPKRHFYFGRDHQKRAYGWWKILFAWSRISDAKLVEGSYAHAKRIELHFFIPIGLTIHWKK